MTAQAFEPRIVAFVCNWCTYIAADAAGTARARYSPNVRIIRLMCSGCQICIPLCPYSAIEMDKKEKVAVINDVLCKGCGVCVAACPGGAARQKLFEYEQIMDEIKGVLAI